MSEIEMGTPWPALSVALSIERPTRPNPWMAMVPMGAILPVEWSRRLATEPTHRVPKSLARLWRPVTWRQQAGSPVVKWSVARCVTQEVRYRHRSDNRLNVQANGEREIRHEASMGGGC